MKPFINTNKFFRINVSKTDENFIEDCKNSKVEPHTMVFYNGQDPEGEGVELLNKILTAAKLDDKEFILIDHTRHSSIRVRELHNIFPSLNRIIVFGLPGNTIGLNARIPTYIIQSIGPYRIIFADELAVLSTSDNLKRLLWTSLKSMFIE